jgi:ABC-type bacteriocin/lantibiotic exporter with double-glycine peptidase domain/CRP-like cAMP-binding protein
MADFEQAEMEGLQDAGADHATGARIIGARAPTELLRGQPLLNGLPPSVRELVIESFAEATFALGEDIVRQGDSPDGFYVLTAGRARAIREENGAEVPLGMLGPGDSFGESGLLEHAPRRASVRAEGPVTVLRLEPALFGAIVRRHPEVGERLAAQGRARTLEPLLRSHPVFSSLPHAVLIALVAELEETTLPAGSTVFAENDPAGALYFVVEGRLRVWDRAHGDLRYLRGGDVFGEVSLFLGSSRTATVEAVSAVRLLALEASVFHAYQAEHPAMRERVAEQLAFYERGPARHVPLDFVAELLPTPGAPPPTEEIAATPTPAERPRRLPQALRRGHRRHVPYIPQLDDTDGAAACLAMLCRSFGHDIRIAHVRDLLGTSVGGASAESIQLAGAAAGLEVSSLETSGEQLDELALPAIIRWPGEHWSVLDEVRDEQVHVADPASRGGWISREELLEHWDGLVLPVAPTPALVEAPSERPDLRWLAPLARPHRRLLALVVTLALVAAGLQMLIPVVTGDIIDSVVRQKDYTRLYLLTGGVFALQLVALAAALIEARVIAHVAVRIDRESLDHIAGRLLHLPLDYFDTRRSGDIEHRLSGLRSVREFAAQQGVQALAQCGQLIAAIVLMGFLSVPLMLLWLATAPIYLLLIRSAVRRVRPAYQAEEEGFSRYRSRQLDAIRGMETVKSVGGEEGMRRRMLKDFEDVAQRVAHADLAAISYGGATSFVTFLLLILFLLFGALEVMAGNLTIGALVAFNALVLLSSGPVIWLLGTWEQCQLLTVTLARLRDILDRDSEQPDRHAELRAVPSLEGRVTLTGVGFSYPAAPQLAILEDITLDVLPGTTVAIVGRSGSGKSTLLKCLAGLLQASRGTIAFDAVDLRELRLSDLRRRIGFVPQRPYVFDDTLARNIAFGEDEPDIDAVRAAATVADVDAFAGRLPRGYATHVGEGGLHLSGGQSQRVAIARSIFHHPSVLLLDEATSALDSEAERTVTANMGKLLAGRTAFVVAHRLSTVREADVIVVLEQGRIAEMGDHDELFANDGLYFHLYGQQLAGA